MTTLDPNTPAGRPPPGVIPNFHAYSRAPTLYATCSTATAMMIIFVALRLYSRCRYTKQLASDDYTCIAAAVGASGFVAATMISTESGYGRHIWDYPIATFGDTYAEKAYAVQAMYSPVILITKISLLLLYYRIFSCVRNTRWLIYLGIAVNSAFYAISFALVLYFCGPPPGESFQKAFANEHRVVQARALGTVQASFNIASDIYLLCIPIPVTSSLQLSRKRKFGVIAIFMTGTLAIICSILNLYYRIRNGRALNDFSWAIIPVYITSVVEIDVGIMCCCFPALPPVLRSAGEIFRSRMYWITKISNSRFFKWIGLRREGSTTPTPGADNGRVTLGSAVKGNGHFLTLRSFDTPDTGNNLLMQSRVSHSNRSGQESFDETTLKETDMSYRSV